MTGACEFDSMALGSCGVPPSEVGVNGSVASRYQRPAWSASPGAVNQNNIAYARPFVLV